MANRKPVRTRGKLQFSKYFQKFKEGDKVAVVEEKSLCNNFPKRIIGRTGNILEKRGKAYVIELNDREMKKKFIIEPIHLKKLK